MGRWAAQVLPERPSGLGLLGGRQVGRRAARLHGRAPGLPKGPLLLVHGQAPLLLRQVPWSALRLLLRETELKTLLQGRAGAHLHLWRRVDLKHLRLLEPELPRLRKVARWQRLLQVLRWSNALWQRLRLSVLWRDAWVHGMLVGPKRWRDREPTLSMLLLPGLPMLLPEVEPGIRMRLRWRGCHRLTGLQALLRGRPKGWRLRLYIVMLGGCMRQL